MDESGDQTRDNASSNCARTESLFLNDFVDGIFKGWNLTTFMTNYDAILIFKYDVYICVVF